MQAKVATVLNITPDHMDRYATFDDYIAAKKRIYDRCAIAVCNRDDPLTDCDTHDKFYFTLTEPRQRQFGLMTIRGTSFLMYEDQPYLAVEALPIRGKHYQANALAALAIGHAAGFSKDNMLSVLQSFKGLPHRCQLVLERSQVKWFNDSKGTNVGATIAAIQGLGSEMEGKLVLIAGGLGKSADFSPLLPILAKYVRHVVLIGEAANELAQMLGKSMPYSFAKDMQAAVIAAGNAALPGDSVLLSPACASYDMFKNFEHRGQVFTESVQNLDS